MSLTHDEDGFFGRECPNRDCLEFFKLHIDDYSTARAAHRLTCPACATTESDEHFHTPDQIERTRAAGMELAQGALNQILKDFARRPPIRNSRGAVTFQWNAPLRAHRSRSLPT